MATLIVGPFLGLRIRAVQQLVRPDEVAQFFTSHGSVWDLRTLPERVAEWQANRLRRGDTRYISDGLWDAWQSPAATLQRGGGDCEDHTILLLSLLAHDADVSAQFVFGTVWTGRTWSGHAWVEGEDSNGWFLIEATSGELFRRVRPAQYRPAQVIPSSQARQYA